MIQRVQTLHLLAVVILAAVGLGLYVQYLPLLLGFGLSIILSILTIMRYKDRPQQLQLGKVSIFLQLIILGVFAWEWLSSSGESQGLSEKGVGLLLPVFSIVFLLLAQRAIRKDQELVKSADRLR